MGTRVECPSCNKVMIVRDGGEMPQFCPRCGRGMGQGAADQGESAPERVGCPECGRVLDASRRTAGTEVACPCGTQLRIPARGPAKENAQKKAILANSRYEVLATDGERYAPVASGVLERWAIERRLLPEDQVRRIDPDGSSGPLLRASEHPDLAGLFDQVPSREEVPGTPDYKAGAWLRRIVFGSLGVAAAVVVRRAVQQATSSAGGATPQAAQQPTPVIPDASAAGDALPTLSEAPVEELPTTVDERIQDLSELPDVSATTATDTTVTPDQTASDGAEVAESVEGEAATSQQPAEATPASETDLSGPPAHASGPPPSPEESAASLSSRTGDGQPVDSLSRASEPPLRPPPRSAPPDSGLPDTPTARADTGHPLHIDSQDLEPPEIPGAQQSTEETLRFSEEELDQARTEAEQMAQNARQTPRSGARSEVPPRHVPGQTYQADEDGFNVGRREPPPVRRPQPNVSGPGTAGTGLAGSGAASAGGGLSALAKLLKLLLIAIFIGGTGTAGFYAVRHFGLLGSIMGDSPSAVVRQYYQRLEQGRDVSSLLSTESNKMFSELFGDDEDLVAGLRAKARADAKYYRWHINSERIDGDRAWVMVVTETDDPIGAYLGSMREELDVKNAYNRRQGNDSLIRLNEAYYEQKKRELQTPMARQMAEQLRRMEMPVLCVREGGRWKVAPAEQMDAAFENLDKMFEKMFEKSGK